MDERLLDLDNLELSTNDKNKPPKFKHHTGIISKKATKRINNAIDWLLLLARDKEAFNIKEKRKFKFKICFITLTLSSEQKHSDNEIKNKLLNQFLVEARKKWKVDKYVWRAEKQVNGNIHFHIVIDKFIDYKSLVTTWNRIQNKLGYIDQYSLNQKEFFKNGFVFRKKLAKKWSYARQRKAYYAGKACGFKCPNSTDIHSVKGIKNLSAYLSKYCTKNPKGRILRNAKNCYAPVNFDNSDFSFYNCKPVIEYVEPLVSGKSWGLSQTLSKMKNLLCERDSFVDSELVELENRFYKQMYVGEYYCTLKIYFNQWKTILFGYLRELFVSYLEVARSSFEAENLRICFNL